MPIDPVCKLEISIADAAASHDYYRPNARSLVHKRSKFERDPAVYMENDMSDEERIAYSLIDCPDLLRL